MISSSSNPQIKQIAQLLKKGKARRESGLFVVEGWKMLKESPKDRIQKAYVAKTYYDKEEYAAVLGEKGVCVENGTLEVVDDGIFRSLSDTVTPQGILCLICQEQYKLEEILEKEGTVPFLLILEDLQDPGNLGTIIRTAEGAGVTGIVMSRNCVDLYNPKVIRSTMGSVYRMPVCVEDSLPEVIQELRSRQIRSFAAHLQGNRNYEEEEYAGGTAFLIGNEGNGLSLELSRQADVLIKIPMLGNVESLNAAMAAGILMYEAAKQRRNG